MEYEVVSGNYNDFKIEITPGKISAFDGERLIATSLFGTKHTSYQRGALNLLTAVRVDTTILSAKSLLNNASTDAKTLIGKMPEEITRVGIFFKSKVKDLTKKLGG